MLFFIGLLFTNNPIQDDNTVKAWIIRANTKNPSLPYIVATIHNYMIKPCSKCYRNCIYYFFNPPFIS